MRFAVSSLSLDSPIVVCARLEAPAQHQRSIIWDTTEAFARATIEEIQALIPQDMDGKPIVARVTSKEQLLRLWELCGTY